MKLQQFFADGMGGTWFCIKCFAIYYDVGIDIHVSIVIFVISY